MVARRNTSQRACARHDTCVMKYVKEKAVITAVMVAICDHRSICMRRGVRSREIS